MWLWTKWKYNWRKIILYLWWSNSCFFTKINFKAVLRGNAKNKSYVDWPKMDKDIQHLVKSSRPCALAAKYQSLSNRDKPLSTLHVDNAGPLNNSYYLIVVDRFSKLSEIFQCRRPTSNVNLNFFNCFRDLGFQELH